MWFLSCIIHVIFFLYHNFLSFWSYTYSFFLVSFMCFLFSIVHFCIVSYNWEKLLQIFVLYHFCIVSYNWEKLLQIFVLYHYCIIVLYHFCIVSYNWEKLLQIIMKSFLNKFNIQIKSKHFHHRS